MKNIKNYQPKVEMQEKKIHQKIVRERERERERERTFFFCEGKLCVEWKRLGQIYSKRVWIRRDKNKGIWRKKGRMILL